MKNKTYDRLKVATVLIPILIIILYISQDLFIYLVEQLPPCPVYTHLHLYCPACGNTRSVKALLHGDMISSVKFNITPPIFAILAILAYVELLTYSIRRHIRLMPRKLSYYLIIISILVLYSVLRNIISDFNI